MVFKERFQAARLLSVTSTWGKSDCQPGTRYGILGLTLYPLSATLIVC